jgi:hypothetical protein
VQCLLATLSRTRGLATPTMLENQVLSPVPAEIEITDFLPGK